MKTLDPPGDPLGGLASLDHWSIAARRASSTDGHRLELVSEFQTQDTSRLLKNESMTALA